MSVPELLIWRWPLLVPAVETAPAKFIFAEAIEMSPVPAVVVVTPSEKVIVPVPFVTVKAPIVKPSTTVTLLGPVIVKEDNGRIDPTAVLKETELCCVPLQEASIVSPMPGALASNVEAKMSSPPQRIIWVPSVSTMTGVV